MARASWALGRALISVCYYTKPIYVRIGLPLPVSRMATVTPVGLCEWNLFTAGELCRTSYGVLEYFTDTETTIKNSGPKTYIRFLIYDFSTPKV